MPRLQLLRKTLPTRLRLLMTPLLERALTRPKWCKVAFAVEFVHLVEQLSSEVILYTWFNMPPQWILLTLCR